MFNFIKFFLFKADPEWIHEKIVEFAHKYPHFLAHFLTKTVGKKSLDARLNLNILGLNFPSPIGLAAGFDKNAYALEFLTRLYFGFIEVGTVTPLPQMGNEKPRLFRYPEIESLRNKMGFNNAGMDAVYKNLLETRGIINGKVIGVNLGKNKLTPTTDAPNNYVEDYKKLYQKFSNIADYLVINVSSPNTPGLRNLQRTHELKEIFEELKPIRKKNDCPLFLKISPDSELEDLDAILQICADYKLRGIIATNTTIIADKGEGGFSGRILAEKAKKVRCYILDSIKNNEYPLEVIGVGGISSFYDIWDFWKQGGRLTQIYSSFIFQGPYFLHQIHEQIIQHIEYNGASDLTELLNNIKNARLKNTR